MAIHEHVTEFAGKPVMDWEPGEQPGPTCRISLSWDENEKGKTWTDKFARFLECPEVSEVTGIVVGPWSPGFDEDDSGASRVVEALVAARERLPRLKALFMGDITMEESEISWIEQADVSPLFLAYPLLEHFCVRGGNGLSLGRVRHEHLRSLTVQTGGLSASVLQEISASHFPHLEHLELWLGEENYGADFTMQDLDPFLSGKLFPHLTYLGLRNSELADSIATAIASAPVMEQLKVLDLSMGTLGDEGAKALLASPAVRRLEKLDLHHHFMSEAMEIEIQTIGIEVDASDRQEVHEYDGESWRYVAVGE